MKNPCTGNRVCLYVAETGPLDTVLLKLVHSINWPHKMINSILRDLSRNVCGRGWRLYDPPPELDPRYRIERITYRF